MSKYSDNYKNFNPYRKKPDYYYTFIGEMIFREFMRRNGFTNVHAKIIVILSYYTGFMSKDVKYWLIDLKHFKKCIEELIAMGYVVQGMMPTKKSRSRPTRTWYLTKKGKDIEKDFEKYYDDRFTSIQEGRFGIFQDFKDGKPFRRVRLPKSERPYGEQKKSDGGRIRLGIMDMWKDIDYGTES